MPHTLRKRYPRAAPAATARRSYGPPTLLSSGQLAGGITIPTLSGTPINAQTALSIAAVWNAVLIYANTIASLDFHIARRTGRNGQARTADRKHPSYELVSLTPNGVQTSFRFRQTIVSHAVCRGNGYAEILRAGGRPVALCLMDPTQVTPMVAEDGRLVYQVAGADGPLEARDVLHIAGLGWDGVSGYSPITLNAEALGLAKAEQTWQSGLFGNNATPNGHYEIPGALAKEAKDEFRRQVNLMHGGPSRSGKFGILDGGAKWVQTSFSPSDAQLILGRQFSIAEVARIFNLPQHLLGQLDKATFSNIEEQNIQFYQISLMPWLVSIEQEFTRKLLPRSEWSTYAAWFDPATLLRGNLQARTSHAVQMNRIGVASINDVAEEFGYERVGSPGADKHWVSTNNLTAIEDMDRAAPAAEAAPADDTPDPVQVSAIQNAQLASLLETVAALSEGGLTVPAAKAALRISFPALSDAQIDALLDPLAKPEKPPTTEPPGESPTPPVVKPRQPRAKRIPSKPKEPSETILEPSQGPPEARAESAKPPKRRERRDKAPGSGGCGTGHGGFKAGNKCGKRGSKSSIGDPAPRSPLDAARDRFSSAKAGHAAALSAHRAAPTEKTAAALSAARADLGRSREGYRGAHGSGRIEARPLDGADPRVRRLRADRAGDNNYERQNREDFARSTDRRDREDRALMRVGPHLPVADHMGQAPPKFQQADRESLKRVRKNDEAGRPHAPEDQPTAARERDLSAANTFKPGQTGYLSFDRVTGEYGSHHGSYDHAISSQKWKAVASGRTDLVKAYQNGVQVPITPAMRKSMARPYSKARADRVAAGGPVDD